MSELEANMKLRVKDLIGLRIEVNLVEPSSIPRSEGKAKRVVDER
jgi:phenylacetate-CoA ligase